jgi:coenzyme PQQ precursor peptide PqqA
MAKSDDVLDPVLVWLDGVHTATLSLHRSKTRRGLCQFTAKIPLAKFSFHATLWTRGSSSHLRRRAKMAWKTPKIVEVPVGMEINMYACAARK